MRVIKIKTLKEYWQKHTDIESQLKVWFAEMKAGVFKSPADIKRRYPSADIIAGNRVIFNIKGNHYRLVVKIHYNRQIVYIRFIGTHDEYNSIDVETI